MTDAPDTLSALFKQRRRWTNGGYFAGLFCIMNMRRVHRTAHNCCRVLILYIVFFVYILEMVLQFLLPGFFSSITLVFLRVGFGENEERGERSSLVSIVETTYLFILFFTLLFSVSLKVHLAEAYFQVMSAAIGVLIVFIFIAAFVTTGLDSDEFEYFRWIFIGGWLLSYLVPIFYSVRESCRNIHKYIFGLIVMIFMAPTLFVLISIYSISNIHDCTWGRGALSAEKANKSTVSIVDSYERFRTKILTAFVIVNYAFLAAM